MTRYTSGIRVTNRTLLRMSQLLGISVNTYLASGLVLYLVLGVLYIRSAAHQFSRIRAVRLSLAVILLNTITLLMGAVAGTLTDAELAMQVVPVIGLIALVIVRVRTADDVVVGRRWIPLSRAATITAALFILRQGLLFLLEEQDFLPVLLKILCGLPALNLSMLMWRQLRSKKAGFTALAMLLYWVANSVINLSMAAGVALFALGHVAMACGFFCARRPSVRQFVVWAVVSCLLVAEAVAVRSLLTPWLLAAGIVYSVMLAGMLVLSQPVGRRTFMGCALMVLANQLLILMFFVPGHMGLASVELLLYYIALLCLAVDPEGLTVQGTGWLRRKPVSKPDDAPDDSPAPQA